MKLVCVLGAVASLESATYDLRLIVKSVRRRALLQSLQLKLDVFHRIPLAPQGLEPFERVRGYLDLGIQGFARLVRGLVNG